MVLPGWNVSEPLDLAWRVYRVVESIRAAPEDARTFAAKVATFRERLQQLSLIVNRSPDALELDHLRLAITESRKCVSKCEEFKERFDKLYNEDVKSFTGAKQAARFVWQDKKVDKLRHEIDNQIGSIQLGLTIQAFAESQSRRASQTTSPVIEPHPPSREDTSITLVEHRPHSSSWTVGPRDPLGKTPAEALGMTGGHERRPSQEKKELDKPTSQSEMTRARRPSRRESTTTAPMSPLELPLPGKVPNFHPESPPKIRPGGSKTGIEIVAAPDLSSTNPLATSPSERPELAQIPTFASSESRKSVLEGTVGPYESSNLESLTLEMALENLQGVKLSYITHNERRFYWIAKIEAFRDKLTSYRCIVITPTDSSPRRYHFTSNERILSHSEHPYAYGSRHRYRVKFVKPTTLYTVQSSSSRRTSEVSILSTPSVTPSSGTSTSSVSSAWDSVFSGMGKSLREESKVPEYDFQGERDCCKFQELLMGGDAKLHYLVPVQTISRKRYDQSKPVVLSTLQYIRLWFLEGRQFLLFFANMASKEYKEYDMDYFSPTESSRKAVIKLEAHVPGVVRRNSKSKSPLLIPISPGHEQMPGSGLIGGTSLAQLQNTDYLTIEFANDEGD